MPPRLEERLVVLIPSSRCAQIFPNDPNDISPKRNKSGFVELRLTDGNYSIIEVYVGQAQSNRFACAHARSVEE
jgi:hypothetical protein